MAEPDPLLRVLEGRHRTWDATVAALLLVLFAVVVMPPIEPSHDMAMLLEIARQLVHGAVPYVDWVEVNPPWIHLLLTVPVRVAELVGAPIATTWQLTVAALVAVGVAGVRWCLERARVDPLPRGLILLALVVHALVVANGGDFGQKEHLWFLAMGPWAFALVLLDGRVDDRGGQALLFLFGWMSAVGAQIKPHFVVVGLIFVAILAFRRGWDVIRSPAFLGYAAGGLLGYPVLLAALPTESWEAIRSFYLPELLPQYASMNSPWGHILGISSVSFVLYGLCAAASWWGDRRLARPFAELLLMAVAVYLLQAKGFQYHRVPSLGFAAILAAIGVNGWHTADRPVAAGAWLTSVVGGAFLLGRALLAPPAVDPLWDRVDAYAEPGDPILVIDSAVAPTWPGMLVHGYVPASRWFTVGYPIAVSYQPGDDYRSLDEAEGLEKRVFDEIAADIADKRPPVVIVADGVCKFCPEAINLHELIVRNGFRDGAMSEYERVGEAGVFVIYARE